MPRRRVPRAFSCDARSHSMDAAYTPSDAKSKWIKLTKDSMSLGRMNPIPGASARDQETKIWANTIDAVEKEDGPRKKKKKKKKRMAHDEAMAMLGVGTKKPCKRKADEVQPAAGN